MTVARRRQRALAMISAGDSHAGVARRLGINRSTVDRYVRRSCNQRGDVSPLTRRLLRLYKQGWCIAAIARQNNMKYQRVGQLLDGLLDDEDHSRGVIPQGYLDVAQNKRLNRLLVFHHNQITGSSEIINLVKKRFSVVCSQGFALRAGSSAGIKFQRGESTNRLTKKQRLRLGRRLRLHSRGDLSTVDVVDLIKRLFGVHYSVMGAYRLAQRLGYKFLAPGYRKSRN